MFVAFIDFWITEKNVPRSKVVLWIKIEMLFTMITRVTLRLEKKEQKLFF